MEPDTIVMEHMVDTGDGFTTTSPIPAGGTGNFTISMYDPQNQIITYVVQVLDASNMI